MKVKTWLLVTAAVVAGMAGAVYGVGALLPQAHVARSSAVVGNDSCRVATLVRKVEDQPRWRADIRRIEILERGRGRTRYREHTGEGALTYEIVEEAAGRRFRSTILDNDLPFGGSWTISLTPQGDATLVAIEERGVVRDPLYRVFSTFVFGHEATMERYLRDLRLAAVQAR